MTNCIFAFRYKAIGKFCYTKKQRNKVSLGSILYKGLTLDQSFIYHPKLPAHHNFPKQITPIQILAEAPPVLQPIQSHLSITRGLSIIVPNLSSRFIPGIQLNITVAAIVQQLLSLSSLNLVLDK